MKPEKTKARAPGRPRSDQARQDILKAAYKLLKTKGVQQVGAHEIARAAGVSSATIYRWWKSKEEILFDACLEHMKPILAISDNGSALARLRRYVLRATDFLTSEDGVIMARLVTGIHHEKKLKRMFLERYVIPRRKIQRGIIEDAIASGELKPTDPELLIDALNGPLFFSWLQGHAILDRKFTETIFETVIRGFETYAFSPPSVDLTPESILADSKLSIRSD
jgi:AcrR family transcriptional regulator